MSTDASVTLSTLRKGATGRIRKLPDGEVRAHFIRLGIIEGVEVRCLERLPGGTLVLRYSRQEMAVSHELAREIHITSDGRH